MRKTRFGGRMINQRVLGAMSLLRGWCRAPPPSRLPVAGWLPITYLLLSTTTTIDIGVPPKLATSRDLSTVLVAKGAATTGHVLRKPNQNFTGTAGSPLSHCSVLPVTCLTPKAQETNWLCNRRANVYLAARLRRNIGRPFAYYIIR